MNKQICAWCIHAMVISIWNGIFPNLELADNTKCDVCDQTEDTPHAYPSYIFDTQENYEAAIASQKRSEAWANGGADAYMRAMGQK
jgi:hypothetical protein